MRSSSSRVRQSVRKCRWFNGQEPLNPKYPEPDVQFFVLSKSVWAIIVGFGEWTFRPGCGIVLSAAGSGKQ